MAKQFRLSDAGANAGADAVAALLNSGYIRIYDGVQPGDPDTPVSGQTLLAELRFGNPAFDAASGGVATAKPITKDSSANATGTASWFRCFRSDGSSPVIDGSVGTSNADCIINSVAIQENAEVSITAYSLTVEDNVA